MTAIRRRLPVGIQSFKEIRERGYLYVDKSDTVWHLVNEGKKIQLSEPPEAASARPWGLIVRARDL